MDNCVVCLSEYTDAFSRIDLQSRDSYERNVQRIIEKHLWFWHLKQKSANKWICLQCWKELSAFHSFYKKVEKAHKEYDLTKWSVLKLPKVKEEYDTFESLTEEHNIYQADSSPKFPDETMTYKTDGDFLNCDENIDMKDITAKGNSDMFGEGVVQQKFDVVIVAAETSDCIEYNWPPPTDTKPNVNLNKNIKKTILETTKSKNIKCMSEKSCLESAKATNNKLNELSKETHLINKESSQEIDEYLAQSEYKLFCHLCNKQLSNFPELKSHFRIEHKMNGYAVCCNRKFNSRTLLADHIRLHEDPNYFKCKFCAKILSNRTSYEKHNKCHTMNNPPYSCDICGKSFYQQRSYRMHLLIHAPEEEKIYKCDECDRKYALKYFLTHHQASAHLKKYDKICEICGKGFGRSFDFMRHMNIHKGVETEKVPCDLCGVQVISQTLLKVHKKKMHTEENLKKQICPHCSKVSKNLYAHRQHIRHAHFMEHKHACHICEKKFKNVRSLKEHISTHTREPLYTCAYCPKTFINSSNMYKHRKVAHVEKCEKE